MVALPVEARGVSSLQQHNHSSKELSLHEKVFLTFRHYTEWFGTEHTDMYANEINPAMMLQLFCKPTAPDSVI